jgi:signal transduction histidine kinase/ligand-binding sensor domain-containing protein
LFADNKHNLWIGTLNGLNRFDLKTQKIQRYLPNLKNTANSISHGHISYITQDCENNLLIGTFNSLNVLNPSTGVITRFPVNKNDPYSLSNEFVNSIYTDSSGIVWVGTEKGGLNKYNIFQNPFLCISKDPLNPKSSLNADIVNSVSEDDNAIWIGTAGGGLNRYDKKTKSISYLKINAPQPAANFISWIEIDKENKIWATTWGAGFHKIVSDKNGGQFKTYQHSAKRNSVISNFVASITFEDNFLWIATYDGVDIFDPKTEEFYHVTGKSANSPKITLCSKVLHDKKDNIWITSENGIFRFKYNKNLSLKELSTPDTVFCYRNNPHDKKSISGSYVIDALEDSKGNLWFSSVSTGLSKLEKLTANGKAAEFSHYDQNNGLSSNVIYRIQEDKEGNLWLSSDMGLSKLNYKTGAVRNYFKENGLLSNQFYWGSSFKNKDGILYFGGTNGLNYFNPESIKDNPQIPPVVITDFKIFNKNVPVLSGGNSVLSSSITQTREITLSYQQNVLSFEFAVLSYVLPDRNIYAYKMEGFDTEWFYTDAKRRYVTYTNLKPGKYILQVKGSNSDGVWNQKGISLQIRILPPWWQTWGFRILAVCSTVALAISFYLYKIRRYKKQKQILEHEVSERTKDITLANIKLSQQKKTITRLSKFGKKISATLDLQSINRMTFDYLTVLMDTTNFGIGIYNEENNCIDFPALIESGTALAPFSSDLSDTTSCACWCYKNQQDIFSNNFLADYPEYISDLYIRTSKTPKSLIYLPLTVENKKIGIVTVQSYKANSYSLQDYNVLQTLASYIAIALDNANMFKTLVQKNEELNQQALILNETNTKLEEHQQYIEEQAEELRVSNDQLLERQLKIEEQANELKEQTKILRDVNQKLEEKQILVQQQALELSENNKQLIILNATKDKFFSIIAHDLRNPFNTVMGFADILIQNFRKFPQDKIEKYLGFIYTSSINGNDLLNNLLLWSRSQSGTISYNPVTLDLSTIIDDTISLLEASAQKKGISLHKKIEKRLICRIDENMMKTTLRNLVSNAIKFTSAKGKVTISTEGTEKEIIVKVADTGVGISKEKQAELFRIDRNVSTKGTANEVGTGLGLILCKEFMEKHGGKIWVESEVGKGSNFIFSFPVETEANAQR